MFLVLLARFSLKFAHRDIELSKSIFLKLACAATITLLGPPETCDQIEVAHLSTRGRERRGRRLADWHRFLLPPPSGERNKCNIGLRAAVNSYSNGAVILARAETTGELLAGARCFYSLGGREKKSQLF